MLKNDWRGVIGLVLAAGVALALVGGTFTAELTPHMITSEEIAFLSTLGGASVGAVAAYLGIRHNGELAETEPEPEGTPPDE
jgi:hypothetical membrane protein